MLLSMEIIGMRPLNGDCKFWPAHPIREGNLPFIIITQESNIRSRIHFILTFLQYAFIHITPFVLLRRKARITLQMGETKAQISKEVQSELSWHGLGRKAATWAEVTLHWLLCGSWGGQERVTSRNSTEAAYSIAFILQSRRSLRQEIKCPVWNSLNMSHSLESLSEDWTRNMFLVI